MCQSEVKTKVSFELRCKYWYFSQKFGSESSLRKIVKPKSQSRVLYIGSIDPGSGIPDPGSRKSPIPKGNVLVRTDTYSTRVFSSQQDRPHLISCETDTYIVAAMILTDSTAIFILLCKEGRA